jgi:hypothetical protein
MTFMKSKSLLVQSVDAINIELRLSEEEVKKFHLEQIVQNAIESHLRLWHIFHSTTNVMNTNAVESSAHYRAGLRQRS